MSRDFSGFNDAESSDPSLPCGQGPQQLQMDSAILSVLPIIDMIVCVVCPNPESPVAPIKIVLQRFLSRGALPIRGPDHIDVGLHFMAIDAVGMGDAEGVGAGAEQTADPLLPLDVRPVEFDPVHQQVQIDLQAVPVDDAVGVNLALMLGADAYQRRLHAADALIRPIAEEDESAGVPFPHVLLQLDGAGNGLEYGTTPPVVEGGRSDAQPRLRRGHERADGAKLDPLLTAARPLFFHRLNGRALLHAGIDPGDKETVMREDPLDEIQQHHAVFPAAVGHLDIIDFVLPFGIDPVNPQERVLDELVQERPVLPEPEPGINRRQMTAKDALIVDPHRRFPEAAIVGQFRDLLPPVVIVVMRCPEDRGAVALFKRAEGVKTDVLQLLSVHKALLLSRSGIL